MTRSSGPHETVAGRLPRAASVMSWPMMAKSPSAKAMMSGQPDADAVCAPLACGSGPRRWRKESFRGFMGWKVGDL